MVKTRTAVGCLFEGDVRIKAGGHPLAEHLDVGGVRERLVVPAFHRATVEVEVRIEECVAKVCEPQQGLNVEAGADIEEAALEGLMVDVHRGWRLGGLVR